MKRKIIKRYVSDADAFLKQYDAEHPRKSDSQQREIAKHERIAKLRDEASSDAKKDKSWTGF